MSSFGHVNFAINEKYSKKIMARSKLLCFLVIFQMRYTKVLILNSPIHLGGSFDYDFTLLACVNVVSVVHFKLLSN
jgi:hypothetical protein